MKERNKEREKERKKKEIKKQSKNETDKSIKYIFFSKFSKNSNIANPNQPHLTSSWLPISRKNIIHHTFSTINAKTIKEKVRCSNISTHLK